MKEKEYFVITTRDEFRRIASEDILYVKADGNYSIFYLANVATHFQITGQLGHVAGWIEERLPNSSKNFVKVGRSLIINMVYIYHIYPNLHILRLLDKNLNVIELRAGEEALNTLKNNIIEKKIQR